MRGNDSRRHDQRRLSVSDVSGLPADGFGAEDMEALRQRNRERMNQAEKTGEEIDRCTGTGEAAKRQIRATVTGDGKLDELHLDPQLLRMGQRGPATDSATLATEVKKAVNAALDDLQQNMGDTAASALDDFETNLDQIATGLDRTLDRIETDLARARNRLD